MKNGTVKWFNTQRGYGFITDDMGVDHFVHYTSIQSDGFKSLSEGQAVTFELGDKNGKSQAVNVTVA